MATLLLSNPPRRNAKGRFVKGGSRRKKTTTKRRRRRTTTAAAPRRRRSRRAYANPPARRRRSTGGSARKVRVVEVMTQGAAGVAGYMLTDYGTEFILARLPASMTARLPRAAYPAVKGGVAIVMGEAIRRHGPRQLRKYGPIVALGGVISAGIDIVGMVRARSLSGYWTDEPQLEGYWADEQLGAYGDRFTQMGLEGPVAVLDSDDL